MKRQLRYWTILLLSISLVVLSGCAPGNDRFDAAPAGFWAGLWHGFICLFTFLISLFSDTVRMYETNNIGGWYDFGFILGIAIFFGGSCGPSKKKRKKKPSDEDWEEIGKKVEEKVRKGIKKWVEEKEERETEWEEIGKKIEEKIKRELHNWAEK
ncbi:MAG: hypothetical protein ABIL68_11455 [bacterium]